MDAVRSWDLRPQVLDAVRSADEEADNRDYADDRRHEKIASTFHDNMQHATRANRRYLARALARAHNV
jgi:hypothetical protein